MEATIAIPAGNIRNVGQDGDHIQFEHGARHRLITFRAESIEHARSITARLPTKQTLRFERQWSELRLFNKSLDAAGRHAWVTAAIVLVNILVFIAMAAREKRIASFDVQQLLDWGANFGPLTVDGQWWRLFSATFLHLDPLHLLVNMWAFWNIGRLTERLFGRWLFLFLYASTGTVASIASVVWDPTRVTAGASGAIFGIFGAFLAYLARRRARVPPSVFRAHWLSTLAFVLFSLISGSLQTGIDNAAHIGGLLTGIALGWVLARSLEITGRARLRLSQSTAAVILFAVVTTAGVIRARSVGLQLTPVERYLRVHEWYLRGESENLRDWTNLAGRAAVGTISDQELGNSFETNIAPFWRTAKERLEKQDAGLTGEQSQLSALVLDFVESREQWATEIANAGKNRDMSRIQHIHGLQQQTDRTAARIQRVILLTSMSHRPSALSNSTVMTYVRNHFLSDNWNCQRPPAAIQKSPAATDLATDGPAMRDAIGCDAQRAFETEDFSTLEAMFDSYSKSLGDLPDGGSRLDGVIGGVDNLFYYRSVDWMQELGKVSDWRRAYPNSVTPDLVEAMIFQDWAWAARGGGYANTVSAQALAVFLYRMEMAAATLQETKGRAATSPLWYELSLQVGIAQAIGLEQLRAIYDQGSTKFPGFRPLYRQMLRALMPRWFGSYQQVEKFIMDVHAKTQDPYRNEVYARLWWAYASLERDDINIFEKTEVSWPIMKAGFKDMLERYPRSDFLFNAFANAACQVDDVADYVDLRPILKRRMSSTAWSDKVSVQSCDNKFEAALHAAHIDH